TMKKIATRHGLTCLLHEKPFAGVNGSGKHNNWSLVTDQGENLMKPGKKPHENLQFLLFTAAVIKAVDEHAELLRMAASCPGNDQRLGAAEAPPAIVSIFLGAQLEDIYAQFAKNGRAVSSKKRENLSMGVNSIPSIKKDVTDRNRTSTFAFTGNKFELRMVGSSMSIADPNTVLNTIVADALSDMADELEKSTDFENDVCALISKTINEHKRVVFAGDGYANEWVEEAKKRGLPNKESFVDAIEALKFDNTIRVFEKHKVLSRTELESRAEINYEIYAKTINIEARTMAEMASRKFLPATIRYIRRLGEAINEVNQAVGSEYSATEAEILKECSQHLADANAAYKKLVAEIETAAGITDTCEKAMYFRKTVVKTMEALRKPIDQLELIVDDRLWPVPTYGELIFEV
ncbi:MAG: glutamine synthetase type III, partial [Clostridia bacterium]|nr:glutamine synthetase type III [Clostridia bacterium]